jgi:imidazoleglycerol-phosphate dehydratase
MSREQKRRYAEQRRTTKETDIYVALDVDGSGQAKIDSGIPFLDHMLTLLAVHSLCDLTVQAQGDIAVDDHHTVEDIGLTLGEVLKRCLGDKAGINRYGWALIPMDESLVRVALDFSGRPYLSYHLPLPYETIGGMAAENVREFMQALASSTGMNLHVDMIRGENTHHIIEAAFKALARSIKQAAAYEERVREAWSSKGTLA